MSEDVDIAQPPADARGKPPDLPLETVVEKIFSVDATTQLDGVQAVRHLLSKECSPPRDEVIKHGVVPKLVECLSSDNYNLQCDAAWVLTNIASGTSDHVETVVDAGAVPMFINLLSSTHSNLRDQAVCALGHIAGNDSEYLISCGIIQPLLACMGEETAVEHMRNITSTVSNLCRNKSLPPTSLEAIRQLLPMITKLLNHCDKQVICDACWALSFAADGPFEYIQAVIDSNVLGRLLQLLATGDTVLLLPSLRALGNIVTGNDQQTQLVIDCGALQYFPPLLTHAKDNIQKEAAWTISNITAGQQSQIQAVIDSNLVPPLINILVKGECKAQKEAVWAVANLTAGGTIQQILYTVEMGVLKPLCDLLVVNDTKTVPLSLDAINNILEAAKKANQLDNVCMMIEEYEGLDKIRNIEQRENDFHLNHSIIDKYFNEVDDDT